MFAQVRDGYRKQLESLRTVDCYYSFFLNDFERRCHYVRDGEKYYHGSVDLYPGGGRAVHEAAWNGEVGTSRHMAEYLSVTRKADETKPACPTPEMAMQQIIHEALRMADGATQVYHLKSAQRGQVDGRDCIELELVSPRHRVVTRHAQDVGFLPISFEYYDSSGQLDYDTTRIEYYEKWSLFYPILIIQRAHVNGKPADSMRYEADAEVLLLNERVDETVFTLEPFPNNPVVNLTTLETAPPTDPQWQPTAELGFPYDVFFTREMPATTRRAQAAPETEPHLFAALPATQSTTVATRTKWVVIALCAIVLFGSLAATCIWRFRHRSKTRIPS